MQTPRKHVSKKKSIQIDWTPKIDILDEEWGALHKETLTVNRRECHAFWVIHCLDISFFCCWVSWVIVQWPGVVSLCLLLLKLVAHRLHLSRLLIHRSQLHWGSMHGHRSTKCNRARVCVSKWNRLNAFRSKEREFIYVTLDGKEEK